MGLLFGPSQLRCLLWTPFASKRGHPMTNDERVAKFAPQTGLARGISKELESLSGSDSIEMPPVDPICKQTWPPDDNDL